MHRTIRSAILLFVVVALVGCVSNRRTVRRAPPAGPTGPTTFDINTVEVGPNGTISWADAKSIIQHGNVEAVYQTHAREVRLSMADGTSYSTIEPAIDDVIHWIDEVGKRDQIAIATQ